jgi:hypothetical protein
LELSANYATSRVSEYQSIRASIVLVIIIIIIIIPIIHLTKAMDMSM